SIDLPESIPTHKQVAPARPSGLSPLSLLAIAASFLITFALGLLAPHFFTRHPKDFLLAGNFNTQPAANEMAPADDNSERPRNIGNLQLVVDGGGDST